MVYIRRGVFETNSSSTRSIVIARGSTKPYDYVEFNIGNYGWERNKYYDTTEKASYFYTSACDYYSKDVADDISNLLSPYGINCVFKVKPMFKEFNGGQYLDNGYVAHCEQSGEFVQDLLNDPSRLIDFLFNDESYVETGNDNDDYSVGEEKPDCDYIEYYKGN